MTTPARHNGQKFAGYRLLENIGKRDSHRLHEHVASGIVDTIMPPRGDVSVYCSRVGPPCEQGSRSVRGSPLHEPFFAPEILQDCRPGISIQGSSQVLIPRDGPCEPKVGPRALPLAMATRYSATAFNIVGWVFTFKPRQSHHRCSHFLLQLVDLCCNLTLRRPARAPTCQLWSHYA